MRAPEFSYACKMVHVTKGTRMGAFMCLRHGVISHLWLQGVRLLTLEGEIEEGEAEVSCLGFPAFITARVGKGGLASHGRGCPSMCQEVHVAAGIRA